MLASSLAQEHFLLTIESFQAVANAIYASSLSMQRYRSPDTARPRPKEDLEECTEAGTSGRKRPPVPSFPSPADRYATRCASPLHAEGRTVLLDSTHSPLFTDTFTCVGLCDDKPHHLTSGPQRTSAASPLLLHVLSRPLSMLNLNCLVPEW